jgi:polyisoprenoid-binding protein YceI
MKWLPHLLLLATLAPPAWAQDWKVDYGKSEIRFVIKQMNVPVEGGFKRFNVQAKFDAARPEQGQFRVDVDLSGIDTGSEEGDGEVKRPAWLDVAKHPKASFVSKSIRGNGAGRYTVTGDMIVKGRPRPLSASMVLTPQRAGGWQASGRFALKRSDFDIGGGEWADPSVVANDIDGRFNILLLP